jgi:RND superfamily putative drug exporter
MDHDAGPASRLLERLARAVSGARTRYLTVIFWVVLAAILSVALPSASGMEAPNPSNLPASSQSVVAASLAQRAFGGANETPGILVFYDKGGLDASDLNRVATYLDRIARVPLPGQIGPPAFAGLPAQALGALAKAKNTTLAVPVVFHATSDPARLGALLQAIRNSLHASFGADLLTRPDTYTGLVARFTGPMGIAADTAGLFGNADVTLLAGTTVLILLLLVLIYRSPILPIIPLVGVGLSYLVASALLGALAAVHAIVLDAETVSILTVLMFGAGTDYTLLVVARYREQLGRIADHREALRTALEGSAGAVAMSAGTVVLALLFLLLSRYGPEHRFAIPFALGVGVTALASLTFVPALLAILGRRAFYPRVPRPQPTSETHDVQLVRLVTHRPWAVIAAATVLLGALVAFAPGIRTSFDLLSALPKSSQALQGYNLLSRAEGAGALSPVTVLVRGPGASTDLRAALSRAPEVISVAPPRAGDVGGTRVTEYAVTLRVNPLSNAAIAVLPALRSAALARLRATGAATGTRVYLSGLTAQNADSAALVARDTAIVLPVVLAAIALLILLYLRSLVAAAYLIATVVLSFFASLGLGWIVLHDILGVPSLAGGVVLYAFVFLVALGEDYNIFMVSRIWQERRARPMAAAVAEGMRATGSVITSAGLILAGTFTVLTGLPLQVLLDFGVIAAVGVLVDTFVVRSALVPAITVVLGDRAMWPNRPT